MENTQKNAGVRRRSNTKVRYMTQVGMLSAVATVLMLFEFPLPFVPDFYKIDISEIPVLLGTFAMGPLAGVMTECIKILLNFVINGTTTGGIGELANFLIGCSFTFEFPLMEAGIPVRHILAGRNVPMYNTSIACRPAGRFSANMVVSMRGIQPDRIADAVRISGYYPSVHGAPVEVGSPERIGITDLMHPDYGDAPVLEDGDVPVFWACGVTPQAAVMASKPTFAITHAPGHMFITDVPDRTYMV